ncbi:1,2-phenylacetyl-CoA epoxidase subunit PaaD [Pseudooceanicola onchidii]|uniref:1,2-phenylacetyl-CoA epoxidase subunit PaaD n=1 Tax=Pseudooceanicola onchidii TaxID=2562279 RepID=UPI00197FE055|nr:1,2-phenylacetyl-CoA epoxidase subunit PaaD [Pseudooceanicola onchidii]
MLALSDAKALVATLPDPEIPAVSLVDLGIVRDVAYDDDTLVVTVTPTYTGCPATAVIALDIETALLRQGAEKVRINTQMSPAWTTDWITAEGREKLRAYGIAPPTMAAANCAGMLSAQSPDCPLCGSADTALIAGRGSTPCKAQFRCNACLEPFDYFKAI